MTADALDQQDRPGASEPIQLRRVMILDDSDLDAELLERRIRSSYPGIDEVLWLVDPAQIIDRVASFAPDLVITDYHVPNYDVLATVKELRRRWPLMPVLVVSGLVGEEAATQVLKAGASDFLPKSRLERLSMIIDRELTEARLRRDQAALQEELDRQRRINAAVFEQAPAGLWLTSPSGKILRTNRHGDEMMGGFKGLDVEGYDTIPAWWADTGQPIRANDWPAAQAIERQEYVAPRVMRLQNFQGEERYFNCGAAPLAADDGSSLGVIVSAMDITAEVRLRERLRRAEERVRQMSINQLAVHERQMASLSRELHDDLGQVLSILKLHLNSAVRAGGNVDRTAAELKEALPLVDLSIKRLREVCGELRPSELSDFGLGPAFAAMAAAASRASGVAVGSIETGTPIELAAPDTLAVFRVVQQALTNALQHARAQEIRIELHWLPTSLQVSVQDDGVGFDVTAPRAASQFGLLSMQERMELIGGDFELLAESGKGTRINAGLRLGPTGKHDR